MSEEGFSVGEVTGMVTILLSEEAEWVGAIKPVIARTKFFFIIYYYNNYSNLSKNKVI